MKLKIINNPDGSLCFLLLDHDDRLIATSVNYETYEDCIVDLTLTRSGTIFADIEYPAPAKGPIYLEFRR